MAEFLRALGLASAGIAVRQTSNWVRNGDPFRDEIFLEVDDKDGTHVVVASLDELIELLQRARSEWRAGRETVGMRMVKS